MAVVNSARDMSDWLSPILIKEIRQGMRSRFFVFVFLITQFAMVFFTIMAVASASVGQQSDVQDTSALFWFLIFMALVVMLPLMGQNAIGQEMTGQTIELLMLTRLTSVRIVLGKWFALLSQGFLLVTAILPYLVLRYFLGGVDFLMELSILTILFCLSAVCTGMAVGLSALPKNRVLKGLFFLIGTTMLLSVVPSYLFSGMHATAFDPATIIILFVSLGLPITLLFLEFGASRISPLAENHAARLRVLALLILTVGYILVLNDISEEVVMIFVGTTLLFVCIHAVGTEPVFIVSIYRPFARLGPLGLILGRLLLYPGWPTGLIFSILVFALCLFMFPAVNGFGELFWITVICLYGAFLQSVAIHKRSAFVRNKASQITAFSLTLFIVVSLLLVFIDKSFGTKSILVLSPFPLCDLVFLISGQIDRYNSGTFLITASIGTFISLAILFDLGMRYYPRFRKMEYEAQQRVEQAGS